MFALARRVPSGPVMGSLVKERFDFSGGTVEETDAGPVIRGVVLCGLSSSHGYDYLPAVWSNGRAKEIYEGADSYVDHSTRTAAGKIGWFENVTVREDGRPQGDYHLNPKHPLCESVVWAAKHRPTFYALSHQAHVKWGQRDGKKVVEGINGRAVSVDLVDKGGTLGGLFEDAHGRGPVPTVKEYAAKLGRKCDVEQLWKLKNLVKEDDYGGAPMMPDAPDAEAEDTGAEDGIKSAFCSAIMHIVDKALDGEMEAKVALGKIKTLIASHEHAQSDEPRKPAEEDGPETGGKGKEKVDESAHAKKGPTEGDIVREAFAENLNLTPTRMKALLGMSDKADRTAFIREQKGYEKAKDPKSNGRGDLVNEGANDQPASGVEAARQRARKHAESFQGVTPSKN